MFNQYFSNLTNINRYLTNIENQFDKTLVTLVKNQFVSVNIGLDVGLFKFLP